MTFICYSLVSWACLSLFILVKGIGFREGAIHLFAPSLTSSSNSSLCSQARAKAHPLTKRYASQSLSAITREWIRYSAHNGPYVKKRLSHAKLCPSRPIQKNASVFHCPIAVKTHFFCWKFATENRPNFVPRKTTAISIKWIPEDHNSA